MNKRKVLTLALTVCIVAILAIGGTLAYFTDTDSATNTFTLGNVEIELKEVFDANNAVLRPGSQKVNAVNKDVSIKNTGTEAAYVWYKWYIPSALDSVDGTTGTNNIVHVNSLGATWDKYFENPTFSQGLTIDKTWDHDPDVELGLEGPEGKIGTKTIDGVEYNVYLVLYRGVLAAGAETTQAMDQVYLDSKVDFDGTNYTINGTVINYDFTKNVNIIVEAYGIQAAGFEDVYAAYKAYEAQA